MEILENSYLFSDWTEPLKKHSGNNLILISRFCSKTKVSLFVILFVVSNRLQSWLKREYEFTIIQIVFNENEDKKFKTSQSYAF